MNCCYLLQHHCWLQNRQCHKTPGARLSQTLRASEGRAVQLMSCEAARWWFHGGRMRQPHKAPGPHVGTSVPGAGGGCWLPGLSADTQEVCKRFANRPSAAAAEARCSESVESTGLGPA